MLSLAIQTNATPLPPVPEVFGIRLPPTKDRLATVNFDLVPSRPPPGLNLWWEEVEEEVTESEDDNIPGKEEQFQGGASIAPPVMARDSPLDDVDMNNPQSDDSDGDDGLFGVAEEPDDKSDVEAMKDDSQIQQTQRTLMEDEEYD